MAGAVRRTVKILGDLPDIILAENLTEEEAFALEIMWIDALGRRPDGPLLNRCAGGKGVAGAKRTDDSKARYRKGALERWATATEEERKRVGVALHTDAANARRREVVVQLPPRSEQARVNYSIAAKQRYDRMSPDEKNDYVARLKKNPAAVKLGYAKAAAARTGKKRGPYKKKAMAAAEQLGNAAEIDCLPQDECAVVLSASMPI
jgi:hypothetical protein